MRFSSLEYGFSTVASTGIECMLCILEQVPPPLETSQELRVLPRRDDLQVGSERREGELEANLVVPLPRRSVRHGGRTSARAIST